MQDKDQYYFEGKYFDTQKEFWEYVEQWHSLFLTQETAEKHIQRMGRDMVMNIFLRGVNFTNREFIEYLQKIFEYSINIQKISDSYTDTLENSSS